jgi:hypothetical protein
MPVRRRVAAAVLLVSLTACSQASRSLPPAAPAGPAAAHLATARRATVLFVSPLTVPGKIVALPAASNGKVVPRRLISGRILDFADNYFLAYDARADRIWTAGCLDLSSGGPVVAFAASARGADVKPAVLINGKNTGLSSCQTGIAVDGKGNVYVADIANAPPKYPGGQIAIFGRLQHGNATPIRRIAGSKTGLRSPEGIALDSTGRIYVANSCQNFNPCSSSVTVYAPGATGNAAPVATLAGSKTRIKAAFGLAFGPNGDLYVSDPGDNDIEVFAPGAHGNVAPLRVIGGSATTIVTPSGIQVDSAGYVYLGNFDQSTSADSKPVLVFAPNAAGNVAPVRSISITAQRFAQPSGIALK